MSSSELISPEPFQPFDHPQALLRLVFENAPDFAIFTMDLQRRITSWNVGAESIFGYLESEMLGRSGDIIFVPEDQTQNIPEQEERTALETGRAEDERWHQRRDGSRFFASGVMRPLYDGQSSQPQGLVKILRDLTERKQHEEALQQANQLLEQRILERTQILAQTNAQLQDEIAERKRLLGRLISSQEDERKRLARELHDQFNQSLTFIKMGLVRLSQSSLSGGDSASAPAVTTLSKDLERQVTDLMDQVHRLAWELRTPALETLGLSMALHEYAAEWSRQHEIAVTFTSDPKLSSDLAPEIATAFYRVAQEALLNVSRHAEASLVSIVLSLIPNAPQQPAAMSLIISDDGRGFDPQSATRRLGIIGMHERMQLIGGTLEVESAQGAGTSIFARVPLT